MAAVKRIPIYHHDADYVFWFFFITRFSHFKNKKEFCFKTALGGGALGGMAVLHTSLIVMNKLD